MRNLLAYQLAEDFARIFPDEILPPVDKWAIKWGADYRTVMLYCGDYQTPWLMLSACHIRRLFGDALGV